MKLEEAIELLDRSAGIPAKNNSVRIKQKFSNILQEVKYKDLSREEVSIVEKELDKIFLNLDLEGENVHDELRTRLQLLLNYLRINFSLVPEGYCTTYGLKIGLSTGLIVMLGLLIYTDSTLKFYAPLAGLLLGFLIGSVCDRRRKNRGKSLLTRMV